MINKITLIGRIGQDPESRTIDNGTQVHNFSVATSESYKNDKDEWIETTEWHRVVKWNNLSDRIKKGSLVYVEGKLTHRKYQDKDGHEKYISEIKAQIVRALEKKEGSNTNFPNQYQDAPY